MESCDVLIVGGGPGGSSCAWRLADAGLDVRIIDRKAFPRDKVCAGWITPQVVDALGVDLDAYARQRTCEAIFGFRTGLVGGRRVETRYDHPVSYGIRRCEFDEFLLRRSGAMLYEGEGADSIARTADGWLVNGRIHARMLVGAGGHFCPVARLLGARQLAAASVVAAQEIEFRLPQDDATVGTIEASMPELYFCDDLAGYGWCFRKGQHLNIGLGRTEPAQLSMHMRAFVDYLRERGTIACQVPERFHGHAYQLYERSEPRLCDEAVLLVGDAAGLAYPQSGEGIRPAVESALLAAETIVLAEGDYRQPRLEDYRRRVLARFGPPRGRAASDFLPASWLRAVAGRLLASRTFARNVVLQRWFLHMHDPALASDVPLGAAVKVG